MNTFRRFTQNAARIGISGPDTNLLFGALPESTRGEMWQRLKEQIDDRRYLDGLTDFVSRKPAKVYKLPNRIARPDHRDDRLTEIDADVYLEAFGVEIQGRGRLRCPFPEHEDRNPSASHRGTVWYCHRCAQGGGIYEAASAISGIHTKGRDFLELRRWIAERLIGQVAV